MTLRSLVQTGAGPLAAGAVTRGGEVSPPVVRDEEERHVVRAELVLAADAVRPLREVPLRPDLLQSFAAAVMDVRPELGERVEVCVDLVPLTAAKAARIRRARIRASSGPGGESASGRVSAAISGLLLSAAALLLEFAGEFLPGKVP